MAVTDSLASPSPLPVRATRVRRRRVLPGFGLSLGLTVTGLSLLVLIPLAALIGQAETLGWARFLHEATAPRVLASYRVTLGSAALAGAINVVLGLATAWVLTRYRFPGRRLFDALIDLPFALPTAVAGIALATLLAPNGWVGSIAGKFGIALAFNQTGIVLALTFIGLPYVVRAVQPLLHAHDSTVEEAAHTLGATSFQTFWRVLFPALRPALYAGFAMAFARGIGEYGSVIFIAGNRPMSTEIAPLLVVIKLEQFDYAGASAVAVVLLALSFVLLWLIQALQAWRQRGAPET